MLSPRLQSLIDKLSNPDVVARVRLVRETKAVYEDEHPSAAKGKAQAAGANRAKGVTGESRVTPFAEWLADQLGVSPGSIEKLITLGNRIPDEVLAAVAARDETLKRDTGSGIKAKKGLLERLASKLDKNPDVDWRLMIEQHIDPPRPAGDGLEGGVHLGGPYFFLGEDAKPHLEALIAHGHQFDAAIIDPPYGTNLPRRVNGMMADDQKGALWVVPMLAKLVKPGGVIGVWCTGGTLGRWANALLGEQLTIAQWVTWDKQSPWQAERGDEVMLVAGRGIPTSYGAPLFEVAVPTLPANAWQRTVHDTPKPVDLFVPILERWTKPGDQVLDCFAGLAPLGVACLQHGRSYHGYELDPAIAPYALRELKAAAPAPRRRPVVTPDDHAEWQRLFDARQAAKGRNARSSPDTQP